MCEECGCSDLQAHADDRADGGVNARAAASAALLTQNDRLAERSRGFFRAKRVFAVNLLSFSGSNTAAFVARTVADFGARRRLKVLTAACLERIHAAHRHDDARGHAHEAAPGDHPVMDAHAIGHALDHLDLDQTDVLLIVNGGSATCQAVYDLGESARAALFSTRDGALKPLKFPLFFSRASVVVLNDADQAAARSVDLAQAHANIGQVAPQARVFDVAPAAGAGMEAWYAYLEEGVKQTGRK